MSITWNVGLILDVSISSSLLKKSKIDGWKRVLELKNSDNNRKDSEFI